MTCQDILIKLNNGLFGFRVAGIFRRCGMVLLQHPHGDPAYAFPGGHVTFGETSSQALIREMKEEICADVRPIRLVWVDETFWTWGSERCHQVGFYYLAELCDEAQIPLQGRFSLPDAPGIQRSHLEFAWTPLDELDALEVYPPEAKEKLKNLAGGCEHWVYVE